MKKHFSTILLFLFFFIGLSLLLYPTVSDMWNSYHQSAAISSYMQSVVSVDMESYVSYLEDARAYNASLAKNKILANVTKVDEERYDSLLNLKGNDVMGYINIPSISCSLPVYHGTDEAVLQIAVGHIAGTSLPVGGESTHCVLSGHRGLPSARLFTDIDKLVLGDTFILYVLDEVLTYEVDQILIVEPDDLKDLEIIEGKDLVTLVTCTPYGINSHRMLVRGHRIETEKQAHAVRVTADAVQIEPMVVAPVVAAPMLLLLLLILFISSGSGKKRYSRKRK